MIATESLAAWMTKSLAADNLVPASAAGMAAVSGPRPGLA